MKTPVNDQVYLSEVLPNDQAACVEYLNEREIYDRTLGPGSALQLARGRNALWSSGGLMLPLPVQ